MSNGDASGARFFGLIAALCAIGSSHFGADLILGPYYQWSWSYAVPWIIVAIISASVAKSLANEKRIEVQTEEDEIANKGSHRFALFLRPFSSEGEILFHNSKNLRLIFFPSSHYVDEKISLEHLLAQSLRPSLKLQVIGGNAVGPGIIRIEEKLWRKKFPALIKKAQLIIVLPFPSKELPWECNKIREEGLLKKTLFITPRTDVINENIISRTLLFNRKMESKGFHFLDPEALFQFYTLQKSGEIEKVIKKLTLNHFTIRKVFKELNSYYKRDTNIAPKVQETQETLRHYKLKTKEEIQEYLKTNTLKSTLFSYENKKKQNTQHA